MGASNRSEADNPTPEQRLRRAEWSLEFFKKERDKYQRHMDTTAAEIAELEKQILDQQRSDVTVEGGHTQDVTLSEATIADSIQFLVQTSLDPEPSQDVIIEVQPLAVEGEAN